MSKIYFYAIKEKKKFKKQDNQYANILNINGYPLDNYQKKVVYSEDKHIMVIAGAGSGKSTTIIGKIKYLVKAKGINPNEIVAISFTNKSVNSLVNSLEKNEIYNIKTTTFHKLALEFLNKPNILNDNYLEYIIREYLLTNEYTFKKNIIINALKENNYRIIKSKLDIHIKQLIKTINLCHTYNYNIKEFNVTRKRIIRLPFWKRKKLLCLLYIIMDIYYLYKEEKESTNSVDFDDIIINATSNVKKSNINYKYIIIDEYQDTSLIRVQFIKEIIKKCNCKLMVVGDDYQSIYRFNGCDINIFLNFKKYFPNSKIFKLQNTYRNSQELINISKNFILKNPFQIKKKLKSSKRLEKPIRYIYYNNDNKETVLYNLINYVKTLGNYLILGRNNFDLSNITKNNYNFLTIHKSKGLEADNVIIINLEDTEYGLPNKIIDSEIFKYLFNNNSNYLYDEERRLFYVALTRTKNYVFLFINKQSKSTFLKEIEKLNK